MSLLNEYGLNKEKKCFSVSASNVRTNDPCCFELLADSVLHHCGGGFDFGGVPCHSRNQTVQYPAVARDLSQHLLENRGHSEYNTVLNNIQDISRPLLPNIDMVGTELAIWITRWDSMFFHLFQVQ